MVCQNEGGIGLHQFGGILIDKSRREHATKLSTMNHLLLLLLQNNVDGS